MLSHTLSPLFSQSSALLSKAVTFPKPAAYDCDKIARNHYSGPSKAETLNLRKSFLSPALCLYYKDPIMIVEGNKQYLFDEHGKRYLDCIAGIVTVSVGHCHPEVNISSISSFFACFLTLCLCFFTFKNK